MSKFRKVLFLALIVLMLLFSFACVVDDNSVRVLTADGQGTEGECPEGTHPVNTPMGDICAED